MTMRAIVCMVWISSSQGLVLRRTESKTNKTVPQKPKLGPIEQQWTQQGFKFREIQDQTLDAAAMQKVDKAQYTKCVDVRPLMSCMMKTYKWGFVWLHGVGSELTEKFYRVMLVPQILAVTGMPPGSGLSVFPQAPEQQYLENKTAVKAWHKQERAEIDVNYKPPHHGHSLEDGVKNVPIVNRAIHKLLDLGIPASRILVAGHSQGGSMAYLSAMMFPRALLGAINLSGGTLGWWKTKEIMTGASKGLPMLWVKGNNDQITSQAHQDEVLPVLKENGFQIETSEFTGGHDLTDPLVLPKVASFINKQLALRQYKSLSNPRIKKAAGEAAPTLGGIFGVAEAETTTAEPEKAWIKEILTAGDGTKVPPPGGWPDGTIITVDYVGEREDYTTFRNLKDYKAILGSGNVIECLDECLRTMEQYEEAIITCPPETAYGSKGRADSRIGPNETLYFTLTVKLVYEGL